MSKVIVKMSFKHPNFKNTKGSNVAHLNYIGTRPGVDKTVTEADLQKELSGKLETENEDYVKYINERPRSHGLFGADGSVNIEEIKSELSNHDGFVWRAIISIREEDAIPLGYDDKERWQDLLRKEMPDMAYSMGIKLNNLRWVSAIHMEKGHPHAHVMIWEEKPEARVGVISKKIIENIRKHYVDEVFQDEKVLYISEKNAMRELIRDYANNEVGQIAKLIKEVRATREEVKALASDEVNIGLTPRLYSDIEIEMIERMKKLADIMPGGGRVNLKFMPETVKVEVKNFADYILSLNTYVPSVAKYLKAVENNTRLYTEDEETIKGTVERAYNDIRDRVCQLILKGAVESITEEKFHVNEELANIAAAVIKEIDNKMDLYPEHHKVLLQISQALIIAGHKDEFLYRFLEDFCAKENINIRADLIQNIVAEAKNEGNLFKGIPGGKNIDFYLSVFKLAGYSEDRACNLVKLIIKNEAKNFSEKLNELKKNGYFSTLNGNYTLTDKGIEEYLKTKRLYGVQKDILLRISQGDNNLNSLYDSIAERIVEKDPEEFKVGRYDLKIREEFGDKNSITLNELKENIFNKYINSDSDNSKAEKEFDVIKNRIEKLCLNGFVALDKATDTYSFTSEGMDALQKIPEGMDFTKYDANITLSYIDAAKDGVLTKEELKTRLFKEINNQSALSYYDNFTSLLAQDKTDVFITVDNGKIKATEEGQALGLELNRLDRFFKESNNGNLSVEKIRQVCDKIYGPSAEQQFEQVLNRISEQVHKGNILQNIDGSYCIDPLKKDISSFLYHIYKAGGSIELDKLKETLEGNIPNKEAEKQFNYIVKRLENAKLMGFVAGVEGEYYITSAGAEERLELLKPERSLLRKEIGYLKKLGFIDGPLTDLKITPLSETFLNGMNNKKVPDSVFTKEISSLIEKSSDNISVDKLERTSLRIAAGKYLNNEFNDLKTDYKDLRNACNVSDLQTKTLNNLITALHLSGLNNDEIREVINQWNNSSGTLINPVKLNETIGKSLDKISDFNTYGKTPFISYKDWNEMYKVLGIGDPPRWAFMDSVGKASIRQGLGVGSFVHDLWKSIWNTVESRRLKEELSAAHNKKALAKSSALNSKAAKIEMLKKLKSTTLYNENELDNNL